MMIGPNHCKFHGITARCGIEAQREREREEKGSFSLPIDLMKLQCDIHGMYSVCLFSSIILRDVDYRIHNLVIMTDSASISCPTEELSKASRKSG